jgi:hypothetical protein
MPESVSLARIAAGDSRAARSRDGMREVLHGGVDR